MPDEEGGEIAGGAFGGPPAQREPRYGPVHARCDPDGPPASREIGPTGGSLLSARRRILDCSDGGMTVSENPGEEFSIKGRHGSEDDEPTADFPPRAGRGKKRARTVDELHAVAAAGVAETATATTTTTTTGDEAAVSGGPEGVDAAHGGGIVGALLHFGRVAEAESRSRARDAPLDPTIAGAPPRGGAPGGSTAARPRREQPSSHRRANRRGGGGGGARNDDGRGGGRPTHRDFPVARGFGRRVGCDAVRTRLDNS